MFSDATGHMPEWAKWMFIGIAVVAATIFSIVTYGAGAALIGAAIGAGISLGVEFASDIIEDGQIDHSWKEYLGAGISGFIGGLAGGGLSSMLLGGLGDVVGGMIARESLSFWDALSTFAVSAIFAGVGEIFSTGITRKFASSKYKKIVGNATENIKINRRLAQAGYGNLKIGRDGYDAIIDAITNTWKFKTIKYTGDFVYGLGTSFR